jgi:membrane-bound ClpP family serine protease
MFAIAGIIALVIAAFLKVVGKYPDAILWLIILGAILIGIEAAWGVRRSGWYGRRGA